MINPHNPDFEYTPARPNQQPLGYSLIGGQENPLISIITPFYNTGEVFFQTAQTIFQQSLQQFEWLIINDGSTDPSALKILNEFRTKDVRVRVIDHSENRGLSAARNTGAREARTEYLLFLDSDDLLEPTAAEKWWWFLQTHPQFSFVDSYHVAFGGKNYLWRGGFHVGAKNAERNHVSMMCMMRKSVYLACGGFDETIRGGLEDWEFWMRCAAQGYWGDTLPEFLAWYRVRDDHSDRWDNLREERIQQFLALFHQRYPMLYEGKFPEPAEQPDSLDLTKVDFSFPTENRFTKPQNRLLVVLPSLEEGERVGFTLNLMDELIIQGWQISIVCTAQSENPLLAEFSERTGDIFLLPNILSIKDYPRFLGYFISSRQFDVLLLQESQEGYRLLPFIRETFPQLTIVDRLRFSPSERSIDIFSRLSLLYKEEINLTLVSSKQLHSQMVQAGLSPERLRVCYSGVSENDWQPNPNLREQVRAERGISPLETLILFAGRLEEENQPLLVLETIAHLAQKGRSFRLLIAGEGSLEKTIWEKVEQYELPENVDILGLVPLEQMPGIIAAADILFLPALSSDIPQVIIEAMACEVVPVVPKVSSIRELITPECGFLVDTAPEQQAEHYAGILESLIDDPKCRETMGKAARSRIFDGFTSRHLAENFLQAIKEVSPTRDKARLPQVEKSSKKTFMTEATHVAFELMQAQQEIRHLSRELADLSREAANTRSVLERQIEVLKNQVALQESRIAENERQIAHFNQELTSIFRSRSWRYTRPLRTIARFIQYRGFSPADREVFISKARIIFRRLPLSSSMLSVVDKALIKFADSLTNHNVTTPMRQDEPPILSSPPEQKGEEFGELLSLTDDQAYRPMRPACCALEPKLVSVILPVYNQANYLKDSIESVLQQTYQNIELIVLNDGSTDDIDRVFEQYVGHPKIRLLTQENQKLPAALSNAFEWAKGEYWTWTSADNLMEPRHLETLVTKLDQNPEVGMVYADYYAIDDRGNLLQDPWWRRHNRPDLSSGEVHLPRSTENLNRMPDNFIGPCFMYRGWIGRILGAYDAPQGVEDYDYWMRMNALFNIQHLGTNELLYRYRVHDNTLNARAQQEKIPAKLQDLMDEELKRSAYFQKRMLYIADYLVSDWLSKQGIPPEDILNLDNYTSSISPFEKPCAVAVSASNLRSYQTKIRMSQNLPLIVFFDTPNVTPYDVRKLLSRRNVLAVVRDAKTARRVRLVAAVPVIDREGSDVIKAVNAFVKSTLFRDLSRPFVGQMRIPAEPFFVIKPYRNVLLQVDSFLQGGMENVVIDLAVTLEKAGFCRPRILVLGSTGEAVAKARKLGISVDVNSNMSQQAYRKYLQTHHIHLVNAHYSTFGAEITQGLGIPFVQTIHNSYVWLDPLQVEAYRSADKHTQRYTCVSFSAAKYADVVIRLDPGKMQVIPNGIDTSVFRGIDADEERARLREKWQIDDHSPVFLNVASIMGSKAQLPLVEAFANVVKMYPDSRLVLLGAAMEPAYLEQIKEFVHANNLDKHVIFAGYDPHVAAYYYACDVFVLPSYWEGWSLSLGEAIFTGMPVVATNVGAAMDFSDLENMIVIEPPYGDITNIHAQNLAQVIMERSETFIHNLAQSMISAIQMPRVTPGEELLARLDRENAYKAYISFYKLLMS